MNAPKIIDVVEQGGSQVVTLPPDIRLPNGQVEVSQSGDTVTLRAVHKRKTKEEIDAWFAGLAKFKDVPFMEDGREQPPMPPDDDVASFE